MEKQKEFMREYTDAHGNRVVLYREGGEYVIEVYRGDKLVARERFASVRGARKRFWWYATKWSIAVAEAGKPQEQGEQQVEAGPPDPPKPPSRTFRTMCTLARELVDRYEVTYRELRKTITEKAGGNPETVRKYLELLLGYGIVTPVAPGVFRVNRDSVESACG